MISRIEMCNHYCQTKVAKVIAEPKIFGTADLKHIHYIMMLVPLK